ncbi:hypothetical protein ACXIZN_11710 [Amycolatopsis sp. TRM77291]
MRRLGTILAVAAVSLVTLAGVATAEPSKPGPLPEKVSKEYKVVKKTGKILIRPTMGTYDDPPTGGCWGETSFNTTAYYLDGLLVETDTPYQAWVSCDVATPVETMAFLQTDAGMYINGGKREPDAAPRSCQKFQPSDPICVSVVSSSRAQCFSSERCDGLYGSANTFDMLLPEGWVYTYYPPECTLIAPQEVSCLVGTDLTEIPPTG